MCRGRVSFRRPASTFLARSLPPGGVEASGRCQCAMGLKTFWKDNKVLIVMGTSLGLVHWGWYYLKSSPIFQVKTEDFVPEPGIVAIMMQRDRKNKEK
ncbi:uncharacterized LOC128706665 homolog isoform X2 [Poecile atricapillus]|uniref:uncharacterized LOC128706665 homolog isoform X2 n=1 Tax=Poecile atricapillus TaxID=48891 RepID=UPI0027393B8D|nr:uncharacterized LOC128706665 homolog isoform X2 [Poecile atricapillus]